MWGLELIAVVCRKEGQETGACEERGRRTFTAHAFHLMTTPAIPIQQRNDQSQRRSIDHKAHTTCREVHGQVPSWQVYLADINLMHSTGVQINTTTKQSIIRLCEDIEPLYVLCVVCERIWIYG